MNNEDNNPEIVQSQAPIKNGHSRAMWITIILIVLLVVIAMISLLSTTKTNNSIPKTPISSLPPAVVSITANGFVPSTVKIKAGQAVVWTNYDSAQHSVASDPYPTNNELAGFDDKSPLAKSDSYSFIFNKAGNYTYHDNLNPYKFHGEVIVTN